MAMLEADAPSEVKHFHARFWFCMCIGLVGLCVIEVIGMEIFDAIFSAILAVICWYMLKENCKNMSKYCLLMFGMICLIQAVFELITLATSIGGRRIQKVVKTAQGPNSVSYTTSIETHPFFDKGMTLAYNIKGAALVIAPSLMVIGTLMSYWTYKAFPAYSDFDEGPPIGGGGHFGRGGFGGYGAAPAQGVAGGGGDGGEGAHYFGGSGQSLAGNGTAPQQSQGSGPLSGGAQGRVPVGGSRNSNLLFQGSGHRLGG